MTKNQNDNGLIVDSLERARDAIEDAVAADVVEVICCKDCKWFDPDENIMPESGRCGYHEMVKMFWDFCSCGKKGVVD